MNKNGVSRGTKCFSAFHGTDTIGAFPRGFLGWLKEQQWVEGNRCHLCSGRVEDEGSFKVDIRPEMNPDLVADARNTDLEADKFDSVIIDPPYSKELAQKLYGTAEHWSSINSFVKEAMRIVCEGGTVVTLTYEIPKIPKNANLLAVWGIYTVPHRTMMRCLTVFRKKCSSP